MIAEMEIIKKITNFSKYYKEKYLLIEKEDGFEECSKDDIEKFSFCGLQYFFHHSLYQGRNDKLSAEVDRRVNEVLRNRQFYKEKRLILDDYDDKEMNALKKKIMARKFRRG